MQEFYLLLRDFMRDAAEHHKSVLIWYVDEVVASEPDDDYDADSDLADEDD